MSGRCVAERRVALVLSHVVLLVVDEVPSLREVRHEILHDGTLQADGHVGPSHAAVPLAIELVVLPLCDVLEIHDTSVIVVLTGKDYSVQVTGMSVCDGML